MASQVNFLHFTLFAYYLHFQMPNHFEPQPPKFQSELVTGHSSTAFGPLLHYSECSEGPMQLLVPKYCSNVGELASAQHPYFDPDLCKH